MTIERWKELKELINSADSRWTDMTDSERIETGYYDNRFDYIFNEVVEAGYYVVDKATNIYY